MLFCHATPRSDEELVTPLTPDAEVVETLDGCVEDVIVCGHIHIQNQRRIGTQRLINAGSIGMPYESQPGAYWTVLGPGIEFRRTAYDFDAAAAQVAASGIPDAEERAVEVRSPSPKTEALDHFESLRRRSKRPE